MTDTESRLRDYLQAKAGTIPDDAEAPGLETPRARSRAWIPLLAAAAVAVLIASMALVARLNDAPVAPVPQPPGLKVPYVLSMQGGERTLHDGDQVVRLTEDVADVLGRVSGGWLISYTRTSNRIGVLAADGTVRQIGPATDPGIRLPVLSPDHTQVAGLEGSKLQVYDVASGRPLAGRTLPYEAQLHGWNQAGLWASNASNFMAVSQLSVWQPKTGQLTSVTLPKTASAVDVARQSSGILTSAQVGGRQNCLTSAQLSGGRLTTGRQYCEQNGLNPVLSPDGASAAVQVGVFDVRSGKLVPFQLGQAPSIPSILTFEDAEHVLVVGSIREVGRPAPTTPPSPTEPPPALLPEDTVYRCAVASGACEKVFTSPDSASVKPIEA
ncbi:hypothetical protein ACQPXM_13570 [Kribbella sp. CA-253562]|uniref:hypothetical protein n=1 Tax=Kribbella sp. CA-253562 TaxID=3239942 RepID=UPI003D8DDAD5